MSVSVVRRTVVAVSTAELDARAAVAVLLQSRVVPKASQTATVDSGEAVVLELAVPPTGRPLVDR